MTHPMTEICETVMAQGSSVGPQLAKGAVMSAGMVAGRSVLGRLLTNPLVLLAAGAAIGYCGYKYRKEIAAALAKGTDLGKDMVLNARESLADLVEEAREAEETPAKASE